METIQREPGSKFKSKKRYNDPRDQVKDEARKYLLSRSRTDDNFGGDIVYTVIDSLDEKFLKDPQLAAGLAIIIGERSVQATALMIAGTGGINIKEHFAEITQAKTKDIANFYKDRKDYRPKLEELFRQYEVKKAKE
jgi:hypothetical protein